jgi:hypothetical protein
MTDAVDLGLLVMYAEDMYSAHPGSLSPAADPRIAASGWTTVAYLTAQDAVFPSAGDLDRTLTIDNAKRVFYGFVARNDAAPTSYVTAIRGTDGIVEWVIDAEFVPIPHPRHLSVRVEQGFWGIYQTMSLADPASGATTHQNAAEGVAALVGTGPVVVTGHSLGSAIATYFVDDLAERIGAQASACLFASPRTGDAAWATLFDREVQSYRLYNYILDLVTHVPSLGYATLPKATVIQPNTAQAGIRLDILCNHHVICYCAMIDYAKTMAAQTTGQDAGCRACILGPAAAVPNEVKGLAAVVNAFGIADAKTLVLLKALHPQARVSLASNPAPQP